jgi:hypothetical protein
MDETTGSVPINNPEIPQDDTEDIPFSPQVDTGFGLKEVLINGQTITVHETNRLRDALASYFKPAAHNQNTLSQLEILDQVYGPRIKTGQFEGVFSRIEHDYPKLFAKITGMIQDFYTELDEKNQAGQQYGRESAQFTQVVDKWKSTEDDINLKEYFYSKFFDAMAIAGPEIDLQAPLSMLCEG